MNPVPIRLTCALSVRVIAAFTISLGIFTGGVHGDASVAPATAPTTRPASNHPAADTATRFHNAILKGDADAAVRTTAQTPKPVVEQRKRIDRLIIKLKDDQPSFAVYDVATDGDLAVALVGPPSTVGDKKFEADMWFLIRQAGEWRLLPDYEAFNRPEYGFEASRIEAYEKLVERAEKRILELKLEITGCAC